MQSREYIKNKARKLAKQTWAGPGKFGVFILLCIMIIATFESLGLSNREKNLEFRSVQKIVIPINNIEKNIIDINDALDTDSNSLNEKLRKSTEKDFNKKIIEREKILLDAAMEQKMYENKYKLPNFDKLSIDEKIVLFYSELSQNSNRINEFFFDA